MALACQGTRMALGVCVLVGVALGIPTHSFKCGPSAKVVLLLSCLAFWGARPWGGLCMASDTDPELDLDPKYSANFKRS